MMPIEVMKIAQQHDLEVVFVQYGIASRIGNKIVMNINLPQYDKYCKGVLDHEIRHSGKNTKKDLMMDLFEGSIFDNMKFCIRHPKAFSQYIPFGKFQGEWFIDPNMIIVFTIMIILLGCYLSLG